MTEFTFGMTNFGGSDNGGDEVNYHVYGTGGRKGRLKRMGLKVYDASGYKVTLAIYAGLTTKIAETEEGIVPGGGTQNIELEFSAEDQQIIIDAGDYNLVLMMSGGKYYFLPSASGDNKWYARNYALGMPPTLAAGADINAFPTIWCICDEIIDASENLKAGFYITSSGSEDLPCAFEIGQGSEDLPCIFEVGQGSEDLSAEFFVKQWQEDLLGEFGVRHSGSNDLSVAFDGQVSLSLPGEFVIRHDSIVDLHAAFDGQVSLNLLNLFRVRQIASRDLAAEFVVRHIGVPVDLSGEFSVAHASSEELWGAFDVRQGASENLLSVFNVRKEASVDLFDKFVIRQETSIDLLGEFVVRHVGAPVDLPGEFVVRHIGVSVELRGKFLVRQSDMEDLWGEFVVRHVGAPVDLPGEFVVRNESSRDLFAYFETRYRPGSVDLYASFVVGQGSEDLLCHFISQLALVEDLYASFDVRHPYPFWTDRELLNGVVHLDEVIIGDAALEEAVIGVMNDIKSWLLANEDATYIQWVDISKAPRAIKRATTYGTVASMYGRRIFAPQNVAVRVAPMDFKMITTHEAAMEYWEKKMGEALENYLDSIGKRRILISTEDEEPEFSMEEIERFTMDRHE